MITIVSGLPRSGTSLMMQILKAGGIQILTDNIRSADVDNPRGYFEYEKVKNLQNDNSWLQEAEGKALKVIAQLTPYLPIDFNYSVILMKRNIDEILLSQGKMVENLGGRKATVGSEVLKKVFEVQLKKCEEYINANKNFKKYEADFNKLVSGNIEIIKNLNSHLDLKLKLENITGVIDKSLYRNKASLYNQQTTI